MRTLALFLLLWTVGASCAIAHEVHHDIAATGAVMVRLTYADGSPFAYEKYELFPDGQEVPVQVGNSDAQGRVVFVPGETIDWRLKAYSVDGHGVDLKFAAPATRTVTAPPASAGPDRATQVLIGLSFLFGLFGLVQLFLRRRRS
jgi:nickel transport protein